MNRYQEDDLRKMMAGVLLNMDAMIWVDAFAMGANGGGRYVSLFNSRAELRLCNVYSEHWSRLPVFIRNQTGTLADDVEVPAKRAMVERMNALHTCPTFQAIRYRKPLQAGQASTDSSWKFWSVLRVLNESDIVGSEQKFDEGDQVATVDQVEILTGLINAVYAGEKPADRTQYIEDCLNHLGVEQIQDLTVDQINTWKGYLDAKLRKGTKVAVGG